MDDIILKLKLFFESKTEISMAFLFGSAANSRMISESDVDAAVWFANEYDLQDIDNLQSEIESLLNRNVDLIVLNSARPTIAWAAMRGKRLLIRDNKLFINKMLEISSEAEDMQDFNIELWELREKAWREK